MLFFNRHLGNQNFAGKIQLSNSKDDFGRKTMEEDLNLFQDNNASQKTKQKQNQKTKKKKITSLKPYYMISNKTSNFLTNISYKGVTEKDLFN